MLPVGPLALLGWKFSIQVHLESTDMEF
jgi:hypothetical protein